MSISRAWINGEPADPAALARFARTGFSHFTTMQARRGAVRGLGLHLARLHHATRELFGAELDIEALRQHLRSALTGLEDASLRVSVAASNFTVRRMVPPARLETLVLVDAPTAAPQAAVHLRSVRHQRYLPQFKHGGNFDLLDLRRRAQAEGHDDALLLDDGACISEGPTFNVGFFSANALVWPQAPMLEGTTMQLLQRAQEGSGGNNLTQPLTVADALALEGGFCCHSGGIWPIAALDGQMLPVNDAAMQRLLRFWDVVPAETP